MKLLPRILPLLFAGCCATSLLASRLVANDELSFFEAKIRPALIEHCLECHSEETEASGGLLLDSRDGWQAGGDSGAAIVPGDATASRLLRAISYDDPNLQMPPEGKLPAAVIADFARWIAGGAADPRASSQPATKKQVGLLVAQAAEHWAYRDVQSVPVPQFAGMLSPGPTATPVDAFIESRLVAAGLTAAPEASPEALVRRLYFDLLGLPPSPEELRQAVARIQSGPLGYAQLVDELLRTPFYGEHFARKWMDVARYAESITLRGFVLPEAWRYRDYLIEAFTDDRPFDQMIREQVAGDLLPADSLAERQRQVVATGFLAMGNTNLEQQDKTQLEMDYIDEQLEVLGRAFLGQTIGCARCHDHKFDPIPTRDYYALAGIFRSTKSLEHENVSKWVEQPLPLAEAEQQRYVALEQDLQAASQQLNQWKAQLDPKRRDSRKSLATSEFSGIVLDDSAAKLVGQWTSSSSVGPYVGAGYVHDGHQGKGAKTATFEPSQLPPGEYRVRLAYTPGTNRASNAMVRVFSADGETTVYVDQRRPPSEDQVFVSLGEFRFEKDGQAFVLVSNADSDGHVVVDGVQFLPVAAEVAGGDAARPADADAQQAAQALAAEKTAATQQQIQQLEKQVEQLQKQLAQRPKYLTLVEVQPPQDIPIHIRGDVHNLGATVPRGFLTALQREGTPQIAADSSGRVELAQWLSSSSNPLTARVYANRVWSWLMGQGLVASVNNFGTTGTPPTHPELLDWLASELVRSGWSTKHLVRAIVHSQAYRRQVVDADDQQQQIDPANTLYWRGHSRRLSAESLRDAMLRISGELDTTVGGSLIRSGTKADYNYRHESTRRSIYHPVLRNSLPELFEAFDFADTSMSIGQRPRSTVATQALALLNHPWVAQRAQAAAGRLADKYGTQEPLQLIDGVYQECLGRAPTPLELQASQDFLQPVEQPAPDQTLMNQRLVLLVHSMFASLDFRYLD